MLVKTNRYRKKVFKINLKYQTSSNLNRKNLKLLIKNKLTYSLTYLLTHLLTNLLTYLLTLGSRVLLEKLTGFQLVNKFPAFYGSRRFITAVTSARQLSLS